MNVIGMKRREILALVDAAIAPRCLPAEEAAELLWQLADALARRIEQKRALIDPEAEFSGEGKRRRSA